MDRAIPNLVVEPVRHEFGLSDAALGVFTGVAFALSYSLIVLPMGRISDRAKDDKMLDQCIASERVRKLGRQADAFTHITTLPAF
jgi:hypothetical protein